MQGGANEVAGAHLQAARPRLKARSTGHALEMQSAGAGRDESPRRALLQRFVSIRQRPYLPYEHTLQFVTGNTHSTARRDERGARARALNAEVGADRLHQRQWRSAESASPCGSTCSDASSAAEAASGHGAAHWHSAHSVHSAAHLGRPKLNSAARSHQQNSLDGSTVNRHSYILCALDATRAAHAHGPSQPVNSKGTAQACPGFITALFLYLIYRDGSTECCAVLLVDFY